MNGKALVQLVGELVFHHHHGVWVSCLSREVNAERKWRAALPMVPGCFL